MSRFGQGGSWSGGGSHGSSTYQTVHILGSGHVGSIWRQKMSHAKNLSIFACLRWRHSLLHLSFPAYATVLARWLSGTASYSSYIALPPFLMSPPVACSYHVKSWNNTIIFASPHCVLRLLLPVLCLPSTMLWICPFHLLPAFFHLCVLWHHPDLYNYSTWLVSETTKFWFVMSWN